MAVSVLIPAYGEAAALPSVLAELLPLLPDTCQVVVAAEDDDPAGGRVGGIGSLTGQAAAAVGDPRIRVCAGGGGLIGGLLEAAQAACHDWVVVMDGDGQHDPETVAELAAMSGRFDVVVGGTVRAGLSRPRRMLSRVATRAVRLRLGAQVNAAVEYPLSGLFATRRSALIDALVPVSPRGFKALLAVLTTVPPEARIRELPSVLRERHAGESKLSWRVIRSDLGTMFAVKHPRVSKR